jgi:hypothetical protein
MTFFKPSTQKRIKKFLKKNGFTIEEGSKHIKATHEATGTKIIFPRSNSISNGVTRDICNNLIILGHKKEDIERNLL